MRYVGIDPGVTGAVAAIGEGIDTGLFDLPVMVIEGKKRRTVLDLPMTRDLLMAVVGNAGRDRVMVLLEAASLGAAMKRKATHSDAGSSPLADNSFGSEEKGGQSVVTLANTFLLNGQIQGMLVSLAYFYGIRYEIINPQVWKRAMMPGEARDKDAARQKAIQLFPSVAEELKLKKHHNRAEALLLAEWGRRRG